ncbi:MAG TPA: hypothetical protein VIT22_07060 [Pseudoxanthomonas sp.]|jgi:hypothetical protein
MNTDFGGGFEPKPANFTKNQWVASGLGAVGKPKPQVRVLGGEPYPWRFLQLGHGMEAAATDYVFSKFIGGAGKRWLRCWVSAGRELICLVSIE